jgi:hypothetical protein
LYGLFSFLISLDLLVHYNALSINAASVYYKPYAGCCGSLWFIPNFVAGSVAFYPKLSSSFSLALLVSVCWLPRNWNKENYSH